MDNRLRNANLLAYDFYPSEGGIQTFMHSLVSADLGIKWSVLTRKADDHPIDAKRPYDVVRTTMRPQLRIIDRLWLKVRYSRFSLPKLIAFQTRRKMIYLARRTNADFLFADQLVSAFAVRTAAWQLGIPWGLGVYGKELLNVDEEKRSLLADADLILACSAYSKELAISKGANEERIKVLHPAVDTDFFRPPINRESTRRQLAVDGRETLVTVAHLVQRKGHEQVIQALPSVKSIHPNIVYLVVGRGPYESHLREMANDLGVSDAIRFCGYVPTQDLPLYYGAADIHVMTSNSDGDVEGFGISFIEAAGCGTPSIGSRSGGIPDAIMDGESGFLAVPGDVHGLSKLIVEMLRNENLRDQMGLAARNMAETRFSRIAFEQTLRSLLDPILLLKQ